MELSPGEERVLRGIPVILPARPGHPRGRQQSDHFARQPAVYVDQNGHTLLAAPLHQRSASVSGHGPRSPTNIITIKTAKGDEHYDSSDWDPRGKSPVRRKPRGRGKSKERHHKRDSSDSSYSSHSRDRRRRSRERRKSKERRELSKLRRELSKERARERSRERRRELSREGRREAKRVEREKEWLKGKEKEWEKQREKEKTRKPLVDPEIEKKLKRLREIEDREKEKALEEVWKKKFEANPELDKKLKKLRDLERKEEEEERRRKFAAEDALKKAQEEAKKKKEEDLKKAAIEEHNRKKAEKEAKEKKEKEAADKLFKERVKATFGPLGYSPEKIEKILEKESNPNAGPKKLLEFSRPTYIKVHRKYLSPDTLDAYDLPWEIDEVGHFSKAQVVQLSDFGTNFIHLTEGPKIPDHQAVDS